MHLGTVSTPVVIVDAATAEPVELPIGAHVVEVRSDRLWLDDEGVAVPITRHDVTVELHDGLRQLVLASADSDAQPSDEDLLSDWPPAWVGPWSGRD